MRRALDAVYAASGAAAALFMVLIALLTLAQVAARSIGTVVPSADDFAGFSMAGAVFFGLTYTLRAGGHVRVLSILSHLQPGVRRVLELMCAGGAALLVGTLVFYTLDMILTTRRLGEYTIGLVPVPKWIPMLLMFAGLLVLLIALLDEFVRLSMGKRPTYVVREEEAEKSIPASAE